MKAVILCAGLGKRARPLTIIRPKSLILVGGIPLVERIIKELHAYGVTDITLIVGYKREMFEFLKVKYNVELRFSKNFEHPNNRTSLLLALDKLDDCLVIDGDIYIKRPVFQEIKPGISQFISQKTAHGLEWEIIADEQNKILDVKKDSPYGFSMSGVSYWIGEAARALREELQKDVESDYCWEDAAIRVMQHVPIYLTPVRQFQWEIDDCYDLIRLKMCSPDELATQCDQNGMPERLGGITNSNYLITQNGRKQVLRIPGVSTDSIIERGMERRVLDLVTDYNITPETIFYGTSGIKTSSWLNGYQSLEEKRLNSDIFHGLSKCLHQLHAIPKRNSYCIRKEDASVAEYIKLYERKVNFSFLEPAERSEMLAFADTMDNDAQVLCHRDLWLGNIMVNEKGDIKLLDFEYSTFCSPYWDVGSFLTESRLDAWQTREFIKTYGDLDPVRVQQARILVDYVWALWGFIKNYLSYGRTRLAEMHFAWERLKKGDF